MQTLIRLFTLLIGAGLSIIGGYLLIIKLDPFQCYQAGACNAGICFLGQLILLLPIPVAVGLFLTHRFVLRNISQ